MQSSVTTIAVNNTAYSQHTHSAGTTQCVSKKPDDKTQPQSLLLKLPATLIAPLLVISLHAALLMIMLHTTTAQQTTSVSPAITGVLIEMPSNQPTKAKREKLPPAKSTAVTKKTITLAPVQKQPPIIQVQESNDTIVDKVVQQQASIVSPRVDATRQSNPAPLYPRASLRRQEQGKVILEVLIELDGSVSEARIKQSSGFKRLDRSALKAVKRWRYIPAQQSGNAIKYWYQQAIVFSLRQ
ncbi:MAG: energy transducer TonB [Gammaproteobacteria bacterium]|nr:energy transducer TonB [Gammaproteobacteria bacterium]